MNIHRYNKDVSDFSSQGKRLASVKPYQKFIHWNNKRNKTPEFLGIRKKYIGNAVNPRKISNEHTVTYVEKYSLQKTPPYFPHKVDYEGDTD